MLAFVLSEFQLSVVDVGPVFNFETRVSSRFRFEIAGFDVGVGPGFWSRLCVAVPTLRRPPVSGRCWFGWVFVSGQSDFNVRNRELFERRSGLLLECEQAQVAVDAGEAAAESRLRRLRRSVDDITQEIVEFNYGLVMSYVSRFTASVPSEIAKDYEAAGRLGLMRAVASFDPEKGRFSSWAYKPIQREVFACCSRR